MENNTFLIALTVSFLLHALVLGYFSVCKLNSIRSTIKEMQLTYRPVKEKKIVVAEKEFPPEPAIIKNDSPEKRVKVLSKKEGALPFMENQNIKDISKLTGRFGMENKQIPQINPPDISKKISIPMIKSEKITNPKYLGYNDNIKQKIQQQAYNYINHPDFSSAEVSLSFVLDSNGVLKQLKIINGRSKASDFMKNIALRSIKEAGPFGHFPPDLPYPELPFNLTITFEVKAQ